MAGIDGVTAHLLEHKAWPAGIAKTVATAVAVATEQQLALPGEAGTSLVKRLARKLLDLDREIKEQIVAQNDSAWALAQH